MATMGGLRPWYWVVLLLWLWLAVMSVAAIHDYGLETVTPLSGPLDAILSILVVTIPVWTFFLARRRPPN